MDAVNRRRLRGVPTIGALPEIKIRMMQGREHDAVSIVLRQDLRVAGYWSEARRGVRVAGEQKLQRLPLRHTGAPVRRQPAALSRKSRRSRQAKIAYALAPPARREPTHRSTDRRAKHPHGQPAPETRRHSPRRRRRPRARHPKATENPRPARSALPPPIAARICPCRSSLPLSAARGKRRRNGAAFPFGRSSRFMVKAALNYL